LATITVPEARLLMIQPFDKTSMNDIERAIQKADLGLTPSNDGTVIRIAIPPLTEERRRELVKLVKKSAEEGKVAVRNGRRDANDDLKKLQKDGEMTEDELRRYTDDVQKLTDKHISDIDAVADKKEKEIMEV
ncbi:ribosome recycling factor, partial [Flavobacterium sp. IR1]